MKKYAALSGILLLAAVMPAKSQPVYNKPAVSIPGTSGSPGTEQTVESPLNQLRAEYPQVHKKLVTAYAFIQDLRYETAGKNLYLFFKSSHQKVNAVFATNGKMKYTVTDLGVNLPGELAGMLLKNYPAYRIFYGRVINTGPEEIYHIVLENSHEYKLLNIASWEITELSSTRK